MKVFISRELPKDAPFRQTLEARGLEVYGESFLILSPLPFHALPECNWIFFSSANAVEFFFRNKTSAQTPPSVKWAAIGPATAKAMEPFGIKADFTGTGDPESTAHLFEEIAGGQTALFPSARHSRKGVQRFLPENIHCITLEIYDNRPLPHPTLRQEEVLVFTSPMNAESYFKKNHVLPGQKIIAIGKSTLETLQNIGIENVIISPESSQAGMAAAVLGVLT